jgi:hypothetical protein
MEIVFHPSARAELGASVDFYEVRLAGLGGRFWRQSTKRQGALPSRLGRARHWLVDFASGSCRVFPSASSIARGTTRSSLSPSLISIGARTTGVGAVVGANNTLEPTGWSCSNRRERRCAGGSA